MRRCWLQCSIARCGSGSPYQLKAVFTSQTQLHIPSPVRIAGTDVGEVVSVTHLPGQTPECEAGNEPYSGAAASIGNVPGNQGLATEQTGTSTTRGGSK